MTLYGMDVVASNPFLIWYRKICIKFNTVFFRLAIEEKQPAQIVKAKNLADLRCM